MRILSNSGNGSKAPDSDQDSELLLRRAKKNSVSEDDEHSNNTATRKYLSWEGAGYDGDKKM